MIQRENLYVAIMAGGIGSRFWPKSRTVLPKQFLDILGVGRSLLQSTFDRFSKIVPQENIYIITGAPYRNLVQEQLPELPAEQIMAEPMRRNTGPCVAYMAYKLYQKNPKATFVVAPSDHLITDNDNFFKTIERAAHFAEHNDGLVTLGIKPHRPHTGYGYIQFLDEDLSDTGLQGEVEGVRMVKTFTEKPNADMAQAFLDSGDFLWNAGIFVWRADVIKRSFEQYQPDMANIFAEVGDSYNTPEEDKAILKAYEQCKNISIDYAIMEYADNVFVLPSSFGWSDLGNWTSLWEQHEKDYLGNAVEGNGVIIYNSENCMVMAPDGKAVIVQGLTDYCVVDTKDVLLICHLSEEQRIKEFHADVKRMKGDRFV